MDKSHRCNAEGRSQTQKSTMYDSAQTKRKAVQKSETPLGPPKSKDREGKCKKLFGVLAMFHFLTYALITRV